jgi:hypothetical protein
MQNAHEIRIRARFIYKVWAGAVQTLLCRSIRDSPGMCCSMRLTALTSLREARGLLDLLSDRQADTNA